MFKQNVLKYLHVKILSPKIGYSDMRLISGVRNVVCYHDCVVVNCNSEDMAWVELGRRE